MTNSVAPGATLASEDRMNSDESPAGTSAWPEEKIESVLEALLFASPDPLAFRVVRRIIPEEDVSNEDIKAGFASLAERYDDESSGVVLVEIAGGWQIQTREDLYEWVQKLARSHSEERITEAALETLAIIAYKQPVTRAEVDAIRGVGCGQMIRGLMDKKMVKVVGKSELPGRPFLYGTSRHFLKHFGLASIKDLPSTREL